MGAVDMELVEQMINVHAINVWLMFHQLGHLQIVQAELAQRKLTKNYYYSIILPTIDILLGLDHQFQEQTMHMVLQNVQIKEYAIVKQENVHVSAIILESLVSTLFAPVIVMMQVFVSQKLN